MEPASLQARVLIVDDDAKSLAALKELLESFGHEVVAAHSGEQAARRVLERDFAAIILDARMPGLDGFDTARLIRARARATPILFLTGAYEDPASMFRGYEAGAVDYIVKPPAPEVLRSKISVFAELYHKNAELRALATRLQAAREEERTRIAREIHDELGQALTGLKMDLAWLARRLPAGEKAFADKAESMFALIDDTIGAVRRIATGLRPEVLDQLGLAAAIRWQAREFQMRTGIRCHVNLAANGLAVDPERSTAAFRIFQELLTNVTRHAAATRVDVSLRQKDGTLVLEVGDNGKGIAEAMLHSPQSLGLLGVRERVVPFGGQVDISGIPGKGTRALVSIPLPGV
jgi:signal transduction histidine kinase